MSPPTKGRTLTVTVGPRARRALAGLLFLDASLAWWILIMLTIKALAA